MGGHVSGFCDQGVCPARHSLVYEVFVSPRRHEAGEEEVPLSWRGLWRVLGKSVDPVRVYVETEKERLG